MKSALSVPWIYDAAQTVTGFARVRKIVICDYLNPTGGECIIDVGCGPGHIMRYLPEGVRYTGFDTDAAYIAEAHRRYGRSAQFRCEIFDVDVARRSGPADIVMFNGVLHHMPDEVASEALAAAHAALAPGGKVLTLDGCYTDHQRPVSRFLLDHDRGRFIRTAAAYEEIMRRHFTDVRAELRGDLSLIPYDFMIMLARKAV